MLCQFSFKNFKSYRNETVFDLQAGNLAEFEDTLIKRPKGTALLPVSVIYGPNGGGKTNLLQAMACLISLIVKPIHELCKNKESVILQQAVPRDPFAFDDMERSGQFVYLMLCTIVDSKGSPMKDGEELAQLSERLGEAICQSIRRGDVVNHYGKGQYLVLLMNTTRENCSIVQKRINYKFMGTYLFTISGVAILMTALLLFITNKRKGARVIN